MMKINVYHHRELSEGMCRRRGIVGEIVTARKVKMEAKDKGDEYVEWKELGKYWELQSDPSKNIS